MIKVKRNTVIIEHLCKIGVKRPMDMANDFMTKELCSFVLCSLLSTHDRGQDSHTDRLSSVNEMFIMWRKQFHSFNATGL